MLNNPKISVIIPVYNASKYLAKCLDSLVCQTYSNLEIICVNDGSTDESLDILNNYAQNDNRIVVYSQDNAGVSSARNYGLRVATGDFISFIDADDWVYLTLYQSFVDANQNIDVDIWMFNVAGYAEGVNDVVQKVFFEASDWDKHTSDYIIHTFDDCKRPFSRNLAVYNKIYKKQFIDECQLEFPVGLKFEDQYFILKAFLNAKTIKFTEDFFYRYRNYHESSISRNVSDKVFDIFEIVDLVEDEIIRLGLYESYKYALFQYKYNIYFQHYALCPAKSRQTYFEIMKGKLLAAEEFGLHPQIACCLSNYRIFELIKSSTFNEFESILASASTSAKQ